MKEGIAARVGRIISGGANMIVDAVENMAPELVMEQAIREIESATEEVRAQLGRVLANKHLATRRLADANSRHDDLASHIELALKENREDLAEAAVAQQLDLEAQIPVLENTIADAAEQEKELEGYLSALAAKRREMKEELRVYRQSRQEAPVAAAESGAKAGTQTRVGKAESAFDRVMEKQTGLASGRGDLKSAQQLAELEDLARRNRIQERLAAARAKVKDQGN